MKHSFPKRRSSYCVLRLDGLERIGCCGHDCSGGVANLPRSRRGLAVPRCRTPAISIRISIGRRSGHASSKRTGSILFRPVAALRRWLMPKMRWNGPLKVLLRNLSITMVKRSEEHTSELQSLMRISYAVFCLKQKKNDTKE